MADTTKDKIKEAGNKIADAAGQAVDWVKEKTGMGSSCGSKSEAGVAGIKPHMDVIASCGKKIGVVDGVEGSAIKLTKNASPDGQHHFLPVGMVDHVDNHVHLNKNSEEAVRCWKSDAASCAM